MDEYIQIQILRQEVQELKIELAMVKAENEQLKKRICENCKKTTNNEHDNL